MKKFITMLGIITLCHISHKSSAQSFVVSTIAGDGTNGYSGDGGPATAAKLYNPADVAVDATGNVYIADYRNHRIRKIDAVTGIINTIAGNGASSYYGDGGPATASYLNYPTEVKLDGAGNIYINDGLNQRIRKISATTGIITTIIGGGTHPYSNGMIGTDWNSTFGPAGMNVDAAGNCYFMDASYEARVLKWDVATGIVHAIIDTIGIQGYGGDGGLAVNALMDNLNYYPGISTAVDAANNLYITDIHNFRIRKVDQSTGIITTIAGSGSSATIGDGGPATAASFNLPYRLAIDNTGSLYFFSNIQIHKIDGSSHILTTIAGGGSSYADGIPATSARIYDPWGIATDASRNIYYADNNGRIRKFTPACSGASAGIITGTAASLCSGSSTTLSLSGATTGADISYLWQYSTDGITWYYTGTSSPIYPTGALTATTYFKAKVTCNTASVSNSTTIDTIFINDMPHAGTITGPDTICVTNTSSLSDTATGGTWSSSDAAIASIGPTGTVTAVTTGTVTIRYIVTNSCGSDTTTLPVYVRPSGLCNTGITTSNSSTTLNIYPNPSDGTVAINLHSPINEQVQITITDVTGKQVAAFTTTTNKETIAPPISTTGIYFLSATTATARYITRLTVTR